MAKVHMPFLVKMLLFQRHKQYTQSVALLANTLVDPSRYHSGWLQSNNI
jgi:hypothetical protein